LEYEPQDYLKAQYGAEKARDMIKLIFTSQEWSDADQGLISLTDLRGMFSEKYPSWAEDLKSIISRERLISIMKPKQGTVDFMRELKDAGYKIFLLSNFSEEGFAWVDEAYPFLSEVDGRVISSHVKLIKPGSEIYKLTLNTYSLEPAETVFIDDLPGNIKAAEDLGVHGILFTDIAEVKKQFNALTA
jgi:putative hydrolase of the HAD superfamily